MCAFGGPVARWSRYRDDVGPDPSGRVAAASLDGLVFGAAAVVEVWWRWCRTGVFSPGWGLGFVAVSPVDDGAPDVPVIPVALCAYAAVVENRTKAAATVA